jgi:multicomponent Na+:H+ antiporter subunit D
MSDLWLHPAVILLGGAALLPLLPEKLRRAVLVIVPLLTFARILFLEPGTYGEIRVLSFTLVFGRVDALSQVFLHILGLMCVVGSLYGLHVPRPAEHVAAWTYAGASLGAVLAGDLLTLFLFWELMALSSVFLVWFRNREGSEAAGYRYLLVHMAGGVALLAGIGLQYHATGSMAFGLFENPGGSAATWLILAGFLLNAAVPPLHAWLPDAYSEGTFNGSVFLCAYTTKTAVYALCRGYAGMDLLIVLGVIMALYGVVYAALENDTRKLLGYHIVSQVGYMVTGVGIGTAMAINGTCAHAFAHILYKGLLFMGTGAVLHMTGRSKFSDLGGLYSKMPWTFVFTLVGGLSIAGFPLFSGFVSKSMIVQAGMDEHLVWAGILLILASSGTFLSIGLKVSYFVWFGRSRCAPETWERASDPPWNMMLAMALTSLLCLFIGCYTPYLYGMLPNPVEYHPFTSYHLSETLQVLLFTALAFFLMVKKLEPKAKISLDLDWFYRRGGRLFLRIARQPVQAFDTFVGEVYRLGGLVPLMWFSRLSAVFDQRVIDGTVDGFAAGVRAAGGRLRRAQRGGLQESLTVAFGVGAVVLGAVALVVLALSRS